MLQESSQVGSTGRQKPDLGLGWVLPVVLVLTGLEEIKPVPYFFLKRIKKKKNKPLHLV